MATRRLIEQLSDRIDELAAAINPTPEFLIIEIPETLDDDAVVARHMQLYPKDRDAKKIVILYRFGDADPDYYSSQDGRQEISRAWREIAHEEAKAIPADELRVLRGRRVLRRISNAENMLPRDRGLHAGHLVREFDVPEDEAIASVEQAVAPGDRQAVRDGFEAVRKRANKQRLLH